MEYNVIKLISVFIKDHFNVPYLYIRSVGDERLSVVFKLADPHHVILLVYKTDNGDYVLQTDDDNAMVILRKTPFNNFVALDYNDPDKLFNKSTTLFSESLITRILAFLNSRCSVIGEEKPQVDDTPDTSVDDCVNDTDEIVDNAEEPITDATNIRNYVVRAIQALPTYKNTVETKGPLYKRYSITLYHKGKTVALDVGVEDDVCVLRSSEMYANYSFKRSRFGNLAMQRNLNPRYPNEVIGASLTTDTVNEVLCYLNDTFKKIPLFDYIRPALNKWDGKGNVVKGKYGSPNQSYLVIFGNYKSVTIKETQIPEELQFVTINCNGKEIIGRIEENGEDIEIVVDRTKIENKDLQSFIDHLVKELNATVITNSTTVPNTNEDKKMENEQSKIDTLFEHVTQWVGKLSVACIPGDPIRYVVKGTNLNSSCSISKHENGVTITSEDKKEYKFSLNKFGSVTLHHDDSVVDEIYGIILNIKYRLDYLYRETPLFTYLFHELFNAQPLGELQKQFTVNLNLDLCNCIVNKIDDDKCHLTFDINECPYKFILAKNADNTGINICYAPESLDISWELKPSLDLFIHKLNLTRTSYDELMGTKENNEDNATVMPEEEPVSYPVIIRKNSMLPTKDNLHHLVGEGVHLIEEAYRLDNDSITVSDTMSILTSGTNVCIRERQLHNSRIYLVNSTKIPTGKFIVILPNGNLPQVRVKLVHRIGIDDVDVERTILEHDAVYSKIDN